eukprot:scaffold123779_cov25-Tisochrysis_lutea.AAC.3
MERAVTAPEPQRRPSPLRPTHSEVETTADLVVLGGLPLHLVSLPSGFFPSRALLRSRCEAACFHLVSLPSGIFPYASSLSKTTSHDQDTC